MILSSTTISNPWWAESSSPDRANAVMSMIRRIRDDQPLRRQMDLHHLRMYTARDSASLSAAEYERGIGIYDPSTLAFNVTAQCVDTLVAKIAKNRPLPMFLTGGGKYFQRKRAKQLGKFIEGIFYQTNQWTIAPRIVRDAAVFGSGVLKIYREDDRIVHERWFPWELVVDAVEAQYGEPPNLYTRKWVDRRRLMALYPKLRGQIATAPRISIDQQEIGYNALADQLLVVEAWHLRSSKREKDGRHVVAIDGCTLLDEQYDRDKFPFALLHAKEPVIGYLGTGKAEELTGLQFEINAIASKIQESYFRTGSYWLLNAGSKIVESHIDNALGTILSFSGQAPQKYDPQGVSADTMEYLQYLTPKANELTGVSQLAAQSLKPAGLNSGKAIDSFNDIETERFVLFGKAYEEFHLEIARHDIALAREIAEEFPDYSVRVPGKRNFGRIAWSEVVLDDDDFVMQAFPTAMLSKTPSERFQQVDDLRANGYITAEQAKLLIDFPDIEAWTDLDQAPQRLIEKWLEEMVEKGIARSPEPFFDLQFALITSQKFYCQCLEDDDVDEDNLQLIRDWMLKIQDLMSMPAPSPAAPGPAVPPQMPAPQGVPG